jgi:putative membrane protein
MGLYQPVLEALGSLLTDFKKKLRFLLPSVAGMLLGVLAFSRLIDLALARWEMPPRFCFLGLILGTLPMVWRQVRKEGMDWWHYALIPLVAVGGFFLLTADDAGFPQLTQLDLMQSVLLGIAVAATVIIPGVEPAVLLSTLGMYEVYVASLADLDLQVLAPMALGLVVGTVAISFLMSRLFARFYTPTFCVIFGIFLSMIPNMLTEECVLRWDGRSFCAIVLMVLGFLVSFWLGDLENNNRRLRRIFGKREE